MTQGAGIRSATRETEMRKIETSMIEMSKIEFDTRRRYVLGLGCEHGASVEEVECLAAAALSKAGVVPEELAGIASLETRSHEPAILAVAEKFASPSIFFDAATLERETPRIENPSSIVFAYTGCHGVAESAALAASGPAAELIVPKMKSAHATAAIARIMLQKH
jgi:cobalt-precorrin 5A hydrolase/precorrin-3B C17-methyltransferase